MLVRLVECVGMKHDQTKGKNVRLVYRTMSNGVPKNDIETTYLVEQRDQGYIDYIATQKLPLHGRFAESLAVKPSP
jgi:hypothetical protein